MFSQGSSSMAGAAKALGTGRAANSIATTMAARINFEYNGSPCLVTADNAFIGLLLTIEFDFLICGYEITVRLLKRPNCSHNWQEIPCFGYFTSQDAQVRSPARLPFPFRKPIPGDRRRKLKEIPGTRLPGIFVFIQLG